MSDAMIAMHGLTKRFGAATVLQDVTASIPAGQSVALWGPNGAGKTTLLRCMLGVFPHAGRITVGGLDVARHGKAARHLMGYVPQDIRLDAAHTVRETVHFIARLRGVSLAAAVARLDAWHLAQTLEQPVTSLSGGMRQKLALACALLGDPPVLLLDEPTSNLDRQTRHELAGLLEGVRRSGKTLLFCSHRAAEVSALADRVLVLERGRIAADGAPATVAAYLREQATLALTLAPDHVHEATVLLAAHDFAVTRNGSHVWITATNGRKAEAMRLLYDARLSVIDLDVEHTEEGGTDG